MTRVASPNQRSLRGTETPEDLGVQQRDSVPGTTIVYGCINFTESLFSVDHVYRTGCHVTFHIHSMLAIVKFDTLFIIAKFDTIFIMYSC